MIDIVMRKSKGFIPQTITRDQAKDTGMAMVLICLLIGYLGHQQKFFLLSILVLLINMIWPPVFIPAAKLWFGLSHLLGMVMSKVILSLLFFTIVTPIGVIRRLTGADSLQLRKWKKDRASVFRVRDHTFTSSDIKHPY